MQGYLEKYTNVIHGFRPRYFVLKDGFLCYGKSELELRHFCRGFVTVNKTAIKTTTKSKGSKSGQYIFTISVGRKKALTLRAPDSETFEKWLEALRSAQRVIPSSSDNFGFFGQGNSTYPIGEDAFNSHELRRRLAQLQNVLYQLQEQKLEFSTSLCYLFGMEGMHFVEEDNESTLAQLASELLKSNQSYSEFMMQCIAFISQGSAIERQSALLARVSSGIQSSNSRKSFEVNSSTPGNDSRRSSPTGSSTSLDTSWEKSSLRWSNQNKLGSDDYLRMRSRFSRSDLHSNEPSSSAKANPSSVNDSLRLYLGSRPTNDPMSKTSMFNLKLPIGCYEPLSQLQRQVEQLQCCYLLDRVVADEGNLVRQLAHLSGFVVSVACFSSQRLTLPFEPVEGETFQFSWETKQGSSISVRCEHVTHKGIPVNLMHVENDSKSWRLTGQTVLEYEVSPNKLLTKNHSVYRLKTKGGLEFRWNMPNAVVTNNRALMDSESTLSSLWHDHFGVVEIKNNLNSIKSVLTFNEYSYFFKSTRPPNYISAIICETSKHPLLLLQGRWNEFLEEVTSPVNSKRALETFWDNSEVSDCSELKVNDDIYGMSNFALALNDFFGVNRETDLPGSDSRFRKDLRSLEQSDFLVRSVPLSPQSRDSKVNEPPKWFEAEKGKWYELSCRQITYKIPMYSYSRRVNSNWTLASD